MTLIKYLSLLPALILYIMFSVAAWKGRNDEYSIWTLVWWVITAWLALMIPFIIFSI